MVLKGYLIKTELSFDNYLFSISATLELVISLSFDKNLVYLLQRLGGYTFLTI